MRSAQTESRQQTHQQPEPPFADQPITPPGIEAKMNPRPRYRAPAYSPAGKLNDKVAIITGGDSGIGRAVAVMYAREGASVAIIYLPEEQEDALKTKAEVENHGREILLLPGDVQYPEFCREAIEQAFGKWGRLDILVNNAAFQKHRESLAELSLEQWDRTFKTNIYGYFHMVKFALPHMKPGASIINTGSITGLEGSKGLIDYSSTKGAIHAFTKSLAQQLVERQIRVNCVAPGPVWTPLNPAEREPGEIADFGADTPYCRPAQPEEIAPAFVFFASCADSSYITGHVLPLLGGDTIAG